MTKAANKMKCPNCGAEMNHHADKVVYGWGDLDEQQNPFGIEGVLEEFHTCPACGAAASRIFSAPK